MRFAAFLVLAGSITSSCAVVEGGDPHSSEGIPPVGGKDLRIRDVSDPSVAGHKDLLTVGNTSAVSGAIVIAVDNFDETQNGKSVGTIYVQDLGSKDPFSGISLFAPSFNPGNLAVSAGDVLDLKGQYQENTQIGATVVFAPGAVLPQISRPVATFRYETQVPDPVDIDAGDLADFKKGRRWLGMLVRIKDVTLQADAVNDTSGRVAVPLSVVAGAGTKCDSPFPKAASMTNDLFDVNALGLKAGKKVTITGVVGFFCNIHLAPRSKADIQ